MYGKLPGAEKYEARGEMPDLHAVIRVPSHHNGGESSLQKSHYLNPGFSSI